MNTLFANPVKKPDTSYANRSPKDFKSKEPPSFELGDSHVNDQDPTPMIPNF